MMSPLWVCMGTVEASRPSWCTDDYDYGRHKGCYQVWLYTPEDARERPEQGEWGTIPYGTEASPHRANPE
jgi:hypothetical protein